MAVVQNFLPGDPLLIDKIVYELKSQGIFDQFRKECIADVDTKPAYQNLRQRVEGSVSGFLNKQKWSSDMNKNQLREMLRKNIHESGFLETGVERIVDQVVNPKMNSIFLPKVTEVVYKFLGIEKTTSDKIENLTLALNNDNLLPTDLEAVSPESEKKFDVSTDSQNLDESKIDEDESPPFEPLEEKPVYVPAEENSVDSHLSGFSGLMSHDSNHSQEFSKPVQVDVSNQDSLLSKQSSEGRLSIVMSDDNDTKMEICEDLQQQKIKSNDIKSEVFDLNSDTSKNTNSLKRSESKQDEKSRDKHKKSHDKHKSRHDSKSERKDDKDKKSDKDRKDHKNRHSSRDKGKEKDRKDSKNSSSKSGKSDKNEKDSKSESKSDKERSKNSSSSSNRHSSSSKDKEKSNSSKQTSKKESSSSSRDRGDNKDKSKSSSSKEKDSKHKDDKSKGDSKSSSKHNSNSKSDKHKKDDKHKSDRHSSSSKNRDKDKKDSKKEKKDNKDDHFSSKKRSDRRSTDRDSNDGQSGLKSSSSSFDSYVSSQTQSKSQESSNSNSNTGSGDSGNSDAIEQFSVKNISASSIDMNTKENRNNNIITTLRHMAIPGLKLIKPKFASNIHEARRLMKIRKQLSLLEKQNILDISQLISKKIMENNKMKSPKDKTEQKLNGNKSEHAENNNKKLEQKINNKINRQRNNDKSVQKVHKNKAEYKTKNRIKLKTNNNKINKISLTPHNKNKNLKKNNSVIIVSPIKPKIKEVTPEPPSPPLKSSVVSAATWDALEAKLHESLKYSTSYEPFDSSENMEDSINCSKDDCMALEVNSPDSKAQRYMDFTSSYITNLQNTIDKRTTTKVESKVCDLSHTNHTKKGMKRKFSEYQSDMKNNNKKFSTHPIEVHENFSLPLSPAESDNSIDKKSDTSESSIKSTKKPETEFIEKVKKTVRAPAKSQRYSSEDLYKPRPLFSGSRRRAGRNMGLD